MYGNTEDGIYWNIKKLKEGGIIRRIEPNKGRYWEIIDNDVNEWLESVRNEYVNEYVSEYVNEYALRHGDRILLQC